MGGRPLPAALVRVQRDEADGLKLSNETVAFHRRQQRDTTAQLGQDRLTGCQRTARRSAR